MPNKEEKKLRREIVKSIRAHEHAQAEAGRPLEKRVLRLGLSGAMKDEPPVEVRNFVRKRART